MDNRALPSLRRAIAALCIALGVLTSVHAGLITVEKALHAAGGQHAASAVAGPVFYGDHPAEADVRSPTRNDGTPGPIGTVSHHHHFIDSPLTLGQPMEHIPAAHLSADAAQAPFDTSLPPESNPGGLERPPKRI